MIHRFYLPKLGTLLIASGLLFALTTSGFAQSPTNEVGAAACTDPNPIHWQTNVPDEPLIPDPSMLVAASVEPEKQALIPDDQIFLPVVQSDEMANVIAAAPSASWKIINSETFEGIWPNGLWKTWDYNGAECGGSTMWNDTAKKAHTGGWSAHPTGGGPYGNNTYTLMHYGPFSLVGAQKARVSFVYWIESEPRWDFFTWGYSCDGGLSWIETSRSGSQNWTPITFELQSSCAGKSDVRVKFIFTSNSATPGEGVYLDNVKIEKFQ